ncbi:hypothetical protein BC830DRAFT_1153563 [Chytriomyces sp. MP71]|nr:hypothetical protein BC830DRAFT_1153563 [Chytriomyces sp. MP71]
MAFAPETGLVDRVFWGMDEARFLASAGVPLSEATRLEDEELEEVEEVESDDENGRRRIVQRALSRSLLVSVGCRRVVEEVDVEERERLRAEFVRIMRERWLDGRETAFYDYSGVDLDEGLDDFGVIGREAEERYFDTGPEAEEGLVEGVAEVHGEVSQEWDRRSKADWADVWKRGSVNDAEYDY